jgi:hypothetical protein
MRAAEAKTLRDPEPKPTPASRYDKEIHGSDDERYE